MARIPTLRLKRKGDGREIIINQQDYAGDVAAWKGWKIIGTTHGDPDTVDAGAIIVGSPRPATTTDPAPKENGSGAADRRLADMTVNELRARAESQGIDLGKATKKADIIAALEAAGSGVDEAAPQGDADVVAS